METFVIAGKSLVPKPEDFVFGYDTIFLNIQPYGPIC